VVDTHDIHGCLTEILASEEFNECYNKLRRNKRINDKLEEVKYIMRNDTIEGNQISKHLFPKIYRDKYHITNLWRYPIESYRLLYS